MNSSLTDMGLELLVFKLKCGEYDGVDIMRAWIAVEELISIRAKEHGCPNE